MEISRAVRFVAVATLAVGLACGSSACELINAPVGADPVDDTNDLHAVAQYCVDQMNQLRATVGAPPLQLSADVEAFSTAAADFDGTAHEVHKYFRETSGGNGASMAENEIPWWKLNDYGSLHAIVREGLLIEWKEGPGGGHYDNMTGPYTEAGCGIAVRNGEVTISQDFR